MLYDVQKMDSEDEIYYAAALPGFESVFADFRARPEGENWIILPPSEPRGIFQSIKIAPPDGPAYAERFPYTAKYENLANILSELRDFLEEQHVRWRKRQAEKS